MERGIGTLKEEGTLKPRQRHRKQVQRQRQNGILT